MKSVPNEWLDFLREQYPKGSRIRLTEMKDDPYALSPGSMGTLEHIDDAGQFHVKWDNGSGLALIIGEDRFQVLPPESQTLKFYMPLTAQLYGRDDWGDLEEYGEDLDGRTLRDYQSCIHEALLENQVPEEKSRGLMRWYDKQDGVNEKVQSIVFDAESRDGQLWCVAECKVVGELLPEEKEALADYISGQASDGWGEGFEQRAIDLEEGELYVSLWNSSNWTIQTEEEKFSPDSLTRLPDLACCGTSAIPVLSMLERISAPKEVYLCLDNDQAGETGSLRMAEKIAEQFNIASDRLLPEHKDWNDDLCAGNQEQAVMSMGV